MVTGTFLPDKQDNDVFVTDKQIELRFSQTDIFWYWLTKKACSHNNPNTKTLIVGKYGEF